MMSMAVIIILIVIIVIQKSVDISGGLHIFIRVVSLNFIGSDMVLNRMDIYLSERGCIFLTSDVDWHTNNVLEAFRIAKKFVEDYRKIDMEVTA